MVREKLAETIDIHVGGSDLTFPHHENEIAQSEAATGQQLANYWMHNGMVKVDGEKMSKSLGNFTTIRELLDSGVEPMAVRLFILQAQYRKPVDFTDDAIKAATNGWETLKEGLLFGQKFGDKLGFSDSAVTSEATKQKFQTAVDDDFNFAGGLAVLFEIAKELRKEGNLIVHGGQPTGELEKLAIDWHTLVELANVLGFQVELTEDTQAIQNGGLSDSEIDSLVEQRTAAKKAKNWAECDRIRDELKDQGITLIDTKEGTTWHK